MRPKQDRMYGWRLNAKQKEELTPHQGLIDDINAVEGEFPSRLTRAMECLGKHFEIYGATVARGLGYQTDTSIPTDKPEVAPQPPKPPELPPSEQ